MLGQSGRGIPLFCNSRSSQPLSFPSQGNYLKVSPLSVKEWSAKPWVFPGDLQGQKYFHYNTAICLSFWRCWHLHYWQCHYCCHTEQWWEKTWEPQLKSQQEHETELGILMRVVTIFFTSKYTWGDACFTLECSWWSSKKYSSYWSRPLGTISFLISSVMKWELHTKLVIYVNM